MGDWLKNEGVYFCLRLKRAEFIQREKENWQRLDSLELAPGVSLYLQGVKVTKTKNASGFDIACKWQRKYRGWAPDEGWFILTNLDTLPAAINAYKKRFDIEEMFKDCKTGGYNLEGTGVQKQRLISLILMIAIAYSSAIIQAG